MTLLYLKMKHSKLFVGPSRIFSLSDLTSLMPPFGKQKRKKGRSTILTNTPELAQAKEARDMKNQPRKRKKITKRNLNFDFEDRIEATENRCLKKKIKNNVGDSHLE